MRHLEPLQPPEVLEGFDEEWDDTLDGEGEPDPNWDAEHETESNESSVTLSSKASSKRTYDEVEYNDVHDDGNASSFHSPGVSFCCLTSICNLTDMPRTETNASPMSPFRSASRFSDCHDAFQLSTRPFPPWSFIYHSTGRSDISFFASHQHRPAYLNNIKAKSFISHDPLPSSSYVFRVFLSSLTFSAYSVICMDD
jgi:hypothetical protein